MVLRAMGMLDDAIRDHLELKRRRGADPGEVDREQAEALAPVSDQSLPEEHSAEMDPQLEEPLAPETGTPVTATSEPEPEEDIQETAELDMEREFEGAAESALQPGAGAGELGGNATADWQEHEAFSEGDLAASHEEPAATPEQTGLTFPEEPPEHSHR